MDTKCVPLKWLNKWRAGYFFYKKQNSRSARQSFIWQKMVEWLYKIGYNFDEAILAFVFENARVKRPFLAKTE